MHNLVPGEQEILKELLDKQASKDPLNNAEKDDMRFLNDTMRPAIPYDRLHPGFDQLIRPDKKKLLDFNKRMDAG